MGEERWVGVRAGSEMSVRSSKLSRDRLPVAK